MARIHNPLAAWNTDFTRYDSLGELIAHIKGTGYRDHYGSWAGGESEKCYSDALNGVSSQDTKYAEQLMAKINASFQDTKRCERVRTVSGSRVHMGAYVSGKPNNMIRRRSLVSDVAPIKLVIETTVSGGMSKQDIQARGAALAALGAVLSKVRPVELWACWGLGSGSRVCSIGMVRIPTTPLSLSQALGVMGTDGFARRIAFNEIHSKGDKYSSIGGWAISGDTGSDARGEKMKAAMGLKPADVLIQGGHLYSRDLIIADPVKWVDMQLAKYRPEA